MIIRNLLKEGFTRIATIDLCIEGEIPKVKIMFQLNPRKAGAICRDMNQENKWLSTPHLYIFFIFLSYYTGLI